VGIRFRCHHCEHELNLKNFQAGRRARCPACSGRFRVPTTSCDFSTPLEDDEQELASTALRADQPGADRAEAAPSFDLKQPTGDLERFKRPAAEPAASEAVASLPATTKKPGSKKRTVGNATNLEAPLQKPAPRNAAAQADAAQAAAAPTAAVPAQSSAGAPTSGEPQAGSAARSSGMPRAIAEAPQAVWYVRPPSGGQFGPADSATFYHWMQENRVAREAYVWRDGWPQWMIAGEAFEEYYGPRWLVPDTPTASAEPTEPDAAIVDASVISTGAPGLSGANIASVSGDAGLGLSLPASEADRASSLAAPLATALATDSLAPVAAPLRPLGRRKRRRTNYTVGISILAIVAIALVVILIAVLMSQ
jgi:hypothetical protein